ncbi:GerW family sporulation protein [Intestinibacillus massiliensis]|uniref:GerW family sporulation protein n=1 Tax=Intestinibacillus massiliensis TaxID=1871029 RepID=UPI000B354DB4|nr:GerW family sporulation protein [Intestinibacillus massiliensis]MCB6364730.1 GerW family sporulation protein [Intestinibacillus massiliensis]
MSEHPISNLMNETMEKIKNLVDANTIVGSPVETKDGTTIIPISRVSFGFGSGGSDYMSKHAKDNTPLCFGGGGGAGVTVTPVAFVVVDRGGARILPINVQADSTVDRLVEMIPDAVSKVSSFFEERKNKGKDDGDLEPDPEI